MNIIETMTSPPVAIGTAGGVTILNTLLVSLPILINVLTVLYLTGLIIHKGMLIYKEIQAKKGIT